MNNKVIKTEQYQDMISRFYSYPYDRHKETNKIQTANVTFQVTDACNLRCTYCVTGDTEILMSDYSHKKIKDIIEGDNILGFNEFPEKRKQDKVISSKVTHVFEREAEVVEITLETGEKIKITPNHKVLVRRNSYDNHKNDFMPIEDLSVGRYIYTHPLAQLPGLNYSNTFSINYKIGYLVGMLKGDGSLKHYINNEGYNAFKFRLAVKDIEIIERVKSFLKDLNIDYYLKPYEVSKKESLYQEAIFSNKEETFDKLIQLYNNNFRINKNSEYLIGYLAGFYDAEGNISNNRIIRIANTNKEMIDEGCEGLDLLNIPYIIEDSGKTINKEHKYNIRILGEKDSKQVYKFLSIIRSALPRKAYEKFLNYSPLKRSKIIKIEPLGIKKVYNIETECHTYIANGFCVHNCYQINKGTHSMPFEVAQKFIDMLLENDKNTQQYIDTRACDAIVIEFIGGEPFLEVDLMDQIMEYFLRRMIETDHPWQYNWRISISSNGTLYFEPKVQTFIKKWMDHLSFNISIDGNKKLHDACRIFPDGSGSYDKAIAAVRHYVDVLGGNMGSKMTLAPANIGYTFEAVKGLIDQGYTEINLNCVFEKGWTEEHATILYNQLKQLSDYLLENDLEDKVFIAMYQKNFFKPKDRTDSQNWCWAAGTPILTTNGYVPIEELKIGDKVYTADGSIHPIINIMSHFADNCVTLHNSGTFDLVCTDNHQLYAQPFDHLGNKGIKHWKPYGKYQVKELGSKDYIELFQLPEGKVNIPTQIAYLVGRYVGDGWDIRNNEGHQICCSFDETEDLKQAFIDAGINFTINKNKTVDQFNITQHQGNKFLHDILRTCGHLATGKRLPTDFINWEIPSLEYLLKGYMDADGSKHFNGQNRFNTVSYYLAEDLMLLLRTLGYTPTCYMNKRGGKSTIQGREVNIHDRYEVYFYDEPERTRYVKIYNHKLWTSHLTITPAEPQEVYNITVDTNHSYIAGGIVSANCGGNGSMISVDWKGDIYPCIRYMESSLGNQVDPIIIGNVNTGIMTDAKCHNCILSLKAVNRITQSTEECINCPIAEGCAWCFPAGTKISTPNGYKNIEDLQVNDEILDKDGNIQIVENNLMRTAKEDLIYINAAGILEQLTTKEHPFWCRPVVKRNNNKPIYGEPQWIKAKDLKVSDRIALYVPTPGTKDINKDFAYVIGRYVGDGWKTLSHRELHPYRYYICTAFEEQEEFENKLNNSGIKYSKTKNRTVEEYSLNITGNEYMVSLLNDCGLNAKTKRVPKEIWSWNESSVEAFLKGYFDADGSFDSKNSAQRFTTISYELLLGISELVRMVFHKNVNINISNKKAKAIIEGRTVKTSISYEGRFKTNTPKRKYYDYDEINNIMWVNVSSAINLPPEEEIVYNLTVSNTHNFIANGMIVHNCQAYNYQDSGGDFNHRATYICIMHKARALANTYFWNLYYWKHKENIRFKLWLPDEECLKIISQEELDLLKALQYPIE